MASRPITSWQIKREKVEVVTDFLFWGSKVTADGGCSHEIRRQLLLGRKSKTNLHNVLKSRDITLLTKVYIVKVMVFTVVTSICESWTIKKAECQRVDASELWSWRRTPESPLDSKQSKPVNLEGNQPWILIGRDDAETETPVFWSSDVNHLIGKVSDAGQDWRTKEKKASEDEMAGWHLQCNGHELGQTLGDGEGQGGLACCSPRVTNSWTRLGNWTTTV